MTIVIIDGNVPTTTFIDALINAMAEQGYRVVVIGKKKGTPKYHSNVETVIVPVGKIPQVLFVLRNLFATGFKNFSLIKKHAKNTRSFFNDLVFYLPIMAAKPDRVHLQWATFLHGKELLFDIFSEKIVLSLRGAHINYKPITHPEIRDTYLRTFPKVRSFHAVCDNIGAEAVKYSAAPDRIKTIYSYVNDNLAQTEVKPKEKTNRLKLISIGRFHWKKGYDYALDALAIALQNGVDFTYTIVAQGTIPDDIIFQVNQLGLKDRVNIINGLPHAKVFEAVKDSDVLLLPSVEEGVANVVLEAMAGGTPVISTDCGGMNEVLTNNLSGLVVEIRDTAGMADAIAKFNGLSASERYNMATEAKKRIMAHHTSQVFKKNFAAFYNN